MRSDVTFGIAAIVLVILLFLLSWSNLFINFWRSSPFGNLSIQVSPAISQMLVIIVMAAIGLGALIVYDKYMKMRKH